MSIRPDRRRLRPSPADFGGQTVLYRASDLSVVGTLESRKELVEMARLRGTGQHTSYPKGQIFDVPAYEPLYDDLISRGWAERVPLAEDPGRDRVQVANSMVRNDPLTDPVEAAIAAEIGDADAYGIVHTGDPEAGAAEGFPEPGAGDTIRAVGEAAADLTDEDRKEQSQAAKKASKAKAPASENVVQPTSRGRSSGSGSSSSGGNK